jgi:catechol 2,3-dioxygenase-like lactoylglutathione lyase family enzyme
MAMIPVFSVRSLDEALPFYRDILGFRVHEAPLDVASFYAVLSFNGEEFHLHQDFDGNACRHSAIVRVDDVEGAFEILKHRGYQPPDRPESPVHCGPVDQSWGTREFYVDDPSGNTICFASESSGG